jgi:hypothetical protein
MKFSKIPGRRQIIMKKIFNGERKDWCTLGGIFKVAQNIFCWWMGLYICLLKFIYQI